MEHMHKRLGLRLVLPEAETLRQRDVEKYMAAFRDTKLGDSLPEYHGRTLRAALKAGWVQEIEPNIGEADVADLHPAKVKWFAEKIDRLYTEATTIPPD